MMKVVKCLMAKEGGSVFSEAVDPADYPEYAKQIKSPMDLGTVTQRLTAKTYKTPGEAAADVQLTFANCHAFNDAGSDICILAARLQKVFERLFDTWVLAKSRPSKISDLDDDLCQKCQGGTQRCTTPAP